MLKKHKCQKTIKLNLTLEERAALRKARITISSLSITSVDELVDACGFDRDRGKYLIVISQFQSLVSVGPVSAQYLWDIGCRSLECLANSDPVSLYNKLGYLFGSMPDPCVEDVIRCAIAQAKYPEMSDLKKDWWLWTDYRGSRDVVLW